MRWDRGWRLSAGVRRARGGAIVLNVDASEIADDSRLASLDHPLAGHRGPRSHAKVALEDGTNRIAYGPLADAATAAPTPSGAAFLLVPIPQALEGLAAGEFAGGVDARPGIHRPGGRGAGRHPSFVSASIFSACAGPSAAR